MRTGNNNQTALDAPATRPPGFVHVDLDGLWTLAAGYGYPERDAFERDPVFTLALPRLLGLLEELALPATFFICGRDLELPEKAAAVRAAIDAGHEAACHGYAHRLDLEQAPQAEIDLDMGRAVEAIEAAAGRRPIGHRAAGYGAGDRVLRAAARAGLRYDGSALPTRWAPLLRWGAGRLRRRVGEGTAAAGHGARYDAGDASRAPQWHDPGEGLAPLLRLPLAVSPRLGLPLHASVGIMLGQGAVSRGLTGLARLGHPITYLLHGLDLLGGQELERRLPPGLARARPFRYDLGRRLAFVESVLRRLAEVADVELTERWLTRTDTD